MQSASSFPVGRLLLGLALLLVELLIVDPSEIIVMEGHMFEFGAEDVHLASVLKDNFVVEVSKCFFSGVDLCVLHKGLPNLRLLKDQNFNYCSVGAEQLV